MCVFRENCVTSQVNAVPDWALAPILVPSPWQYRLGFFIKVILLETVSKPLQKTYEQGAID